MDNDLISRAALIAEYDRVHVGEPGGARKLMEEAPAVDAEPVIRCKDCKHCVYEEDDSGLCWCNIHSQLTESGEWTYFDPDDYCSWAEKIEYEKNEYVRPNRCKFLSDDFDERCVNAECPMVTEWCPVVYLPGVCHYEDRGDSKT